MTLKEGALKTQARRWAPIVLASYSHKKWDQRVGACGGRGAAPGSQKLQERERVRDPAMSQLGIYVARREDSLVRRSHNCSPSFILRYNKSI